jgi:RNA polymerase sigma factor (sigma-70 family)
MSQGQPATLLAYLRRLGRAAPLDESDAQLLQRFAAERDEAAFTSLLHRHGPLVWSVCRRVLAEEHAAEDAFQATFLVLLHKAHAVSKKASLRSWLYGVALRVALRARQREGLRRHHEQQAPVRHEENVPEAIWQDVRPILDEEIQRLPEKYRLPVLLCYLEGQTNDEAAQLLNCPRGTIATRLARARQRLRSRLLRRGLTLSVGALAALLAENALSAPVPPMLLAQTAKVVLMGAASTSITTLTEGVLHAMFVTKLKVNLAFVLLLGLVLGSGISAFYLHAQDPAPRSDDPFQKPEKAARERKTVDKPEDRLQKLLKKRRDMAEREWKVRWELFRAGSNEPGAQTPLSLQLTIDSSKRLMKADLELSRNLIAERLKAREKHLERMKELAKIADNMASVGRIGEAAASFVHFELLDADIELEREKWPDR